MEAAPSDVSSLLLSMMNFCGHCNEEPVEGMGVQDAQEQPCVHAHQQAQGYWAIYSKSYAIDYSLTCQGCRSRSGINMCVNHHEKETTLASPGASPQRRGVLAAAGISPGTCRWWRTQRAPRT
jgi:hypothetical protein